MKQSPGPAAPKNPGEEVSVAVASVENGPRIVVPTDPPDTDGLGAIDAPVPPAEVLARLSRESKRGRLAGFRLLGPGVASMTAFGGIYDHELILRASDRGEGARLEFELRLMRKMPTIAVAIIVLMVFPGLQLTDSMLCSYFSWYTIETWWWYMPLTILTLPFMWKQFTASRAAARQDAAATVAKIRRLVHNGGTEGQG